VWGGVTAKESGRGGDEAEAFGKERGRRARVWVVQVREGK
jgi:hypothetical protein